MPGTCTPGLEMLSAIYRDSLLYFQGAEEIPSKHVGYVLRILGQNPTEDDIVAMVMKVCYVKSLTRSTI